MKRKFMDIFVCILLIGAYTIPIISGIDIKKSNAPENMLPIDHPEPSQYIRSLKDIISGNNSLSLTENRPLLVILADFSDKTHSTSHNISYYENMMWGIKPSLSSYYSEVSYGKFTFIPGEVVGWYTINITQSSTQNNYYNYSAFVIKAVQAADEDFNFFTYDTNGDRMISHEELTIAVIHPSDSIVDSLTFMSRTLNKIKTNDKVDVEGRYTIYSEWCPMGVFAHETAHDVGLPDLYDLGYESYGVGDFGLMGYGLYLGPGHMTAWSKIQLGWLTPTIINTTGTYTLQDVETHAEAFILCNLTHSVTEYFLIENRWKGNSYDGLELGWWKADKDKMFLGDLPDEGILIYHIDEQKIMPWLTYDYNTVNSEEEHKGVDVECADSPSSHFIDADNLDSKTNLGDETDLWDNSTYDFDDISSPCNAKWYDGKSSGFAIRDFSAKSTIMTMDISVNFENIPPHIPTITGQESGKVNVLNTYYLNAKDPEDELVYYYLDWGNNNNSGWLGPFKSGQTITVTHGWNLEGNYTIKVKAKDSYGKESIWSDPLPITMPYTMKPLFQQFLERLFERFPNAFPLLRQLMEY